MNRRTIGQILAGVTLLALGLGAGALWGQRRAAREITPREATESTAKAPMPDAMRDTGASPTQGAAAAAEAVEVTLTPEAIERAGIKTAVVGLGQDRATLTVPGTVTSNAYRDTKVNALVGGVVRQVTAELGAAVARHQPLAVIFSADLAEAQMKYLSMRAMLEADHQKRERTKKLVDLGAASRQELEDIVAVHVAHETELAAARQRLLLLGLSDERIAQLTDAAHVVSEVTIRAPGDGVVVTRSVNPGQVVSAGQELFVVTDLTTVWAVGELFERDLPHVRVGTPATIVIPAAPQTRLRAQVSYIDPRVDPAARTAKVRVQVPNPNLLLRLGMFVALEFQVASDQRRLLVPRAAVQAIGESTVVYVVTVDADGRFTERAVKLGAPVGEFVEVLDGLKSGEKIVTEGSFFLRAEAARNRQ